MNTKTMNKKEKECHHPSSSLRVTGIVREKNIALLRCDDCEEYINTLYTPINSENTDSHF